MEHTFAVAELPAFALVGEGDALLRSTETLGPWRSRMLAGESTEMGRLLGGELERATVTLDDASGELEAVLDRGGRRRVLVTVIPVAPPPADPIAVLSGAVASSPAAGWLKDLEGRYMCVNRAYIELLGTSEEQLRGRRDEELSPRQTVDGPRALGGVCTDEPMELEYTVPPFEGRPALAVLRFAVRDREHRPIATCGVAAPLSDPHLAESECIRLLQLERFCRLDATAARAEVLAEWELDDDLSSGREPDHEGRHPIASMTRVISATTEDEAPPPQFEPGAGEPAETVAGASRLDELEDELAEKTATLESLSGELSDVRAQLETARAELRDRDAQLEAVGAELVRARRELEAARAFEAAGAEVRPAPAAPETAPSPAAPQPSAPAAPAPSRPPAERPSSPSPPAERPSSPTPPPPSAAPPPVPVSAERAPVPPPPPPRRGLFARLAGRGRR